MENPRESQSAECENIIGEHLRNADNIRVRDQLKNAVGDAAQQAASEAVPVADKRDEEHRKQCDAAAHREMKQLNEAGDKCECHGHRGENKTARSLRLLICLCDKTRDQQNRNHGKNKNSVAGPGQCVGAIFG